MSENMEKIYVSPERQRREWSPYPSPIPTPSSDNVLENIHNFNEGYLPPIVLDEFKGCYNGNKPHTGRFTGANSWWKTSLARFGRNIASVPFELRVPPPIRRRVSLHPSIDNALSGKLALEQLKQREARKKKKVVVESDSSIASPLSK